LRGGICVEGIVIVIGFGICASSRRDRIESLMGIRNVTAVFYSYGSTCDSYASDRRRGCCHVRSECACLGGVWSASTVVLSVRFSCVHGASPGFYSLPLRRVSLSIAPAVSVYWHGHLRHRARCYVSCCAWCANPLPRSALVSVAPQPSSVSVCPRFSGLAVFRGSFP
jgi:hypothetical protein